MRKERSGVSEQGPSWREKEVIGFEVQLQVVAEFPESPTWGGEKGQAESKTSLRL